MQLTWVAIFFVLETVCVLGGCVEEARYNSRDKRDYDIAEVELIGKDLKDQFDYGLEDKEFLEKKFEAERGRHLEDKSLRIDLDEIAAKLHHLSDSAAFKDVSDANAFLKSLHHILGKENIKEIDLTEEDVSAIVKFLKSLSAEKSDFEEFPHKKDLVEIHRKEEAPFMKLRDSEGVYLTKEEEEGKKIHFADDVLYDEKELKAYLDESAHKIKEGLDVKIDPYLKSGHFDEKMFAEAKQIHADEAYMKAHLGEESYMKAIEEKEKALHVNGAFLKNEHAGEAALKKLFSDEKGALLHDGETILKEKSIETHFGKDLHPAMKSMDEHAYLAKKSEEKAFHEEKPFSVAKTAEEKAVEEWKLRLEEALALGKEHMLDETHKEAHKFDDIYSAEKALETSEGFKTAYGKELNHAKSAFDFTKSVEADKALHESKALAKAHAEAAHKADEVLHGFKTHTLSSEVSAKAADIEKSYAAKDHMYDEILKQEESLLAGGTHAYEKARDQAHKDAKIHATGEIDKKKVIFDESGKALYDPKLHIAEEVGKGLSIHGVEGKIATEKAFITPKSHNIDETLKAQEAHSIAAFEKEKGLYASKEIHGEEALKTMKSFDGALAHGAEAAIYGAKAHADEFLKGEKVHFIDGVLKDEKVFYDAEIPHIKHAVSEDGKHFAHGIETAAKEHSFLHEFEKAAKEDGFAHGVETAAKEHHLIEAVKADKAHNVEKGIEKSYGFKSKFLQFLSKVLGMRKCHLVTMRPSELLSILNCISKSKDPILCEKFAVCETKMPLQVILALEKCQKETIPGGAKKCSRFEPLYPTPEVPLKIFQCMVKNTRELLPVEKKQMIDFEECARAVKAESCGRFKWGRFF